MKIILILLLLISISAEAKRYRKNRIDRMHRKFSNRILAFSREVDAFFADDKHVGLTNRSKLKFAFTTNFREAAGPFIVSDINYNLVLPRTQKRLRIFVENEQEERQNETFATNYQRQDARTQRADSTAAGLRYIINKSGIQFFQDTGVILDVPPRAFVRWTAKKDIMFRDWILKAREQVEWNNVDGITSVLNLDFDTRLTRKFLLRMVNDTLWNDTDYVVTFENGPTLFHKLDDKRGLSYSARVITLNKPTFEVDNYLVQLTYRQNVYRDWLFASFTPFLNFPRANNFHRTPGFIIRTDAVFGHI